MLRSSVATRRRFRDWFRGRASDEDIDTLNSMLNPEVPARDPFVWDGRALASLSRMNVQTSSQGSSNAVPTDVSYELLRQIAMTSETVNAILRRTGMKNMKLRRKV